MDNKDQVKGKVKQAVGDLTDNEDLKQEGEADERAGDVKESLKNIKDKARVRITPHSLSMCKMRVRSAFHWIGLNEKNSLVTVVPAKNFQPDQCRVAESNEE